jgi:thiamine-phosphate pyrophosphorylase
MTDFGLYLVMTNPVVGYHACCEAAVRAGVKMVQLRMKDVPSAEILQVAKDLRSITVGSSTKLIINDDPLIAVESGADGVHVGQEDISVLKVRELFPDIGIVGLSTHNLEQAKSSIDVGPDYIGVGPVYATPTKKKPDPEIGLDGALKMIRAVSVPAVAIGSLDESNLGEAFCAGVVNYAVVRAVCLSRTPYDAIRRLQDLEALKKNKK